MANPGVNDAFWCNYEIKKTPVNVKLTGVKNKGLAMTYFHMEIHTIIGAELFHF
jgi:hypothetical protein